LADVRTKPLSSAKVKPSAVWPPQDGRLTICETGHIQELQTLVWEPGIGSPAAAAIAVYSPSFAPPRRGELSQLMTPSQQVDGPRGPFDNAVCVE
jgi:hypothetical protein